MGARLLMGSKTFESIGKALPGRKNYVASRNIDSVKGDKTKIEFVMNIHNFLQWTPPGSNTFVIGGAEIYRQVEYIVDRVFITRIDADHEGDVYFPEYDWSKFVLVNEW